MRRTPCLPDRCRRRTSRASAGSHAGEHLRAGCEGSGSHGTCVETWTGAFRPERPALPARGHRDERCRGRRRRWRRATRPGRGRRACGREPGRVPVRGLRHGRPSCTRTASALQRDSVESTRPTDRPGLSCAASGTRSRSRSCSHSSPRSRPCTGPVQLLRRFGSRAALRLARFLTLPAERMGEELFRWRGGAAAARGTPCMPTSRRTSPVSGAFGWLLAMLGQRHGLPDRVGGSGELSAVLARRATAAAPRSRRASACSASAPRRSRCR